jgi:hypothetical protein
MIEIFKTDITGKSARNLVLNSIKQRIPGVVATIDLEDRDHVLRVVGAWETVPTQQIIELVKQHGFTCEILND